MNVLEAEETEKCITTRIAPFAMRFKKGNTTSFFPHEKIISTMEMKNRRFVNIVNYKSETVTFVSKEICKFFYRKSKFLKSINENRFAFNSELCMYEETFRKHNIEDYLKPLLCQGNNLKTVFNGNRNPRKQ